VYLCGTRHGPSVLREGTRRPAGAFCCGRLTAHVLEVLASPDGEHQVLIVRALMMRIRTNSSDLRILQRQGLVTVRPICPVKVAAALLSQEFSATAGRWTEQARVGRR
jgi:hypothetical protein